MGKRVQNCICCGPPNPPFFGCWVCANRETYPSIFSFDWVLDDVVDTPGDYCKCPRGSRGLNDADRTTFCQQLEGTYTLTQVYQEPTMCWFRGNWNLSYYRQCIFWTSEIINITYPSYVEPTPPYRIGADVVVNYYLPTSWIWVLRSCVNYYSAPKTCTTCEYQQCRFELNLVPYDLVDNRLPSNCPDSLDDQKHISTFDALCNSNPLLNYGNGIDFLISNNLGIKVFSDQCINPHPYFSCLGGPNQTWHSYTGPLTGLNRRIDCREIWMNPNSSQCGHSYGRACLFNKIQDPKVANRIPNRYVILRGHN